MTKVLWSVYGKVKETLDNKTRNLNFKYWEKNRKGEEIQKSEAVIFYNKNKQVIDISDQITSYYTPLWKTIRWYHKLDSHLLLGTAVVNSLILYKEVTGKNIQISEFIKNTSQKTLVHHLDKLKNII